MADVRRVLCELSDGVDQHDTADKRGKSLHESVDRFARCFGRDRIDADLQDWREAAREIADVQMEDIRQAYASVCELTPMADDAPVIVAGIGAPQVIELFEQSGRPTRLFADLVDVAAEYRPWATRCAPATALALLAGNA
jgi:uncharacterized hydantoinase/oxoprolinase family protein